MIHKQGAEYKDSTEIEEAVQDDEASKKKKFIPFIILGVGILGVVIAIVVILAGRSVTESEADPTPAPTGDDGVVVGDDSYWDQFDEPGVFYYTDEEKQQLRAWGYTGDEIEAHEVDSTDASELIAAAKQEQEEARATLSNPESPEYQALLNNTWLGQQELSLPGYEEGVTEGAIYYDTVTLNADYDKVPAHGHNLFLKVYLDDGSYAFMECSLLRWTQLADSGNIVVTYQTASLNGATIITDMKEVTVQ